MKPDEAPLALSYVLPAYDEEDNVETAVRAAARVLDAVAASWEIVVVDDGSRDRTPEILAELACEIPRLRVITLRPNQGYTNALRTGFLACRMPWVFYTDADNQFHPAELERFLVVRDDADLVVGYRAHRRDPLLRKLLSRGYNLFVTRLLGFRVLDVNCAFKLFRRDFFEVAPIESGGFLVDAEVLVRATRLGLRVKELPVLHEARDGGRTSVSWRSIPETIVETLKLHRRLRGWPSAELRRRAVAHGLGARIEPRELAPTPA